MSEEVTIASSALTVVPAGGALVVGDQAYRLIPLPQPQPEAAQDDGMDLSVQDILRILYKHKWTVLLVVLFACVAGGIHTLMGTPTYRSTVVLQFEKAPQRVAPFADVSGEEQVYMDESMFLQTQYALLKSRALAQRVATELGWLSADRSPFTAPAVRKSVAPQAQGFLDRLLSSYRTLTQPRLRSPEQMNETSAVDAVLGSISVEPGRNTRLVTLQAVHADPDMAARIANVTADTFINMAVERRLDASSYAKTYLQ